MNETFESKIKKYLSENLKIEIRQEKRFVDEPGYVEVKISLEGEVISEDSYYTD